MRIILFCLNEFGLTCLSRLIKNNIKVCIVVVPKKNRIKRIKKLSYKNEFRFFQFDNDFVKLKKLVFHYQPDLIVIASFSRILPDEIINYPKYGTVNIHPSLLPKYRGAHPINWALIKDEKVTGVTIHYATNDVDAGPILAQKKVAITNEDDVVSLKIKLAITGARLLTKFIKKLQKENKQLVGTVQPQKTLYARKRKPSDSKISWSNNTRNVFNLIRASTYPYKAFCFNTKNEKVEIEKPLLHRTKGKILARLKTYYIVSTGDGIMAIKANRYLRIGEVLS